MNRLYPSAASYMLTKDFNWLTDTLWMRLIPAGYSFNETHTHVSHVPAAVIERVLPSGRTVINGMAVAPPTPFNSVTESGVVASAVIYRKTDGLLVAHMSDIAGFPYRLAGVSFVVTPDGADGVYVKL